MVMGRVRPERTPLENEHSRQDRIAWIFALALVTGCSIPIGAAIALRSPTTVPVVVDAASPPAVLRAAPANGGH